MPYEFQITRRVEFSETDMAGIMHFSNFFRFMETAEHAFFRSLGFSVARSRIGLEVCLPRVHAECDYAAPLRFEDEVQVRLLVERKGRRSLTYQFRFSRLNGSQPEEVARGRLTVACVERQADGSLKAVPLPKAIADKIQQAPAHLLGRGAPARQPASSPLAGAARKLTSKASAGPALTPHATFDNSITHFIAMNDTIVSNSSNSPRLGLAGFLVINGRLLGPLRGLPALRPNGHARPRKRTLQGVSLRRARLFPHGGAGAAGHAVVEGATWSFSPGGVGWSLVAGIVGAVGAFGVLLAFGAKGTPAVVMSIVFAGAPVLNAIYSLALHPPAGGWQKLPWPFVLGIVLAAIGGCLVTLYKPAPGAPSAQAGHRRTGGIARGRRRPADASTRL